MAFNLGAYVSGMGTGYNFVQDAADKADEAKYRRTVRAREQKKYDQQDAVEAASKKAMQDASNEADRQNSLPVQQDAPVMPASNVAGAGVTTDPAYASRLADEQSFISGGDVKPEAGYVSPGVGFSKDSGDAQTLAASQGVTNPPVNRPTVSKDDLYWNKYAKDVEAVHLQNGDIAGAEGIRKLANSRNLQEYGKKWMAANTAVQSGDYEGSLPLLENLYNNDYKDGGFVKVTKGDGDAFTVTKYNVDGQPVEAKTATAQQIASGAVNALEPAKYIELEIQAGATDKKYTQQLTLQSAKDTAAAARQDAKDAAAAERADANNATREALADKRMGAILKGVTRSGGRDNATAANYKLLLEQGIAKTPAEAWQMATKLGDQMNEKVSTDPFGNVITIDPVNKEIARYDTEGKKTIVRPGKAASTTQKATIKTLPPGAKQIGTSGGKPVFQDKDGKRFMQN